MNAQAVQTSSLKKSDWLNIKSHVKNKSAATKEKDSTKEAAKNETHEKLSPGEFLHSEKPWSIFIFGGETRNFHQNGMKFGEKIL